MTIPLIKETWNPFIESFLHLNKSPIATFIGTEELEFKSVVEALASDNDALRHLRPQTDKTPDL